MKIIKKGKKDLKPATMEIICGNCSALLLIEARDIGIKRDYQDCKYQEAYFHCPCCGKRGYFSISQLPEEIRSEVI